MIENQTHNAADEHQVKSAKNKERFRREQELGDIKYLLQSIQGRRFIWRLLKHCKVNESIWHASALIHANAGRQDVGHFIMAEVIEANEDAFLVMMKESKKGEI